MADERQKGLRREQILPAGLDISWDRLTELDGSALEDEYRRILAELGKESTNLGVIFRKAQNRIQEPALLRKLIVDLIGSEAWSIGGDLNGDAYEGLLQRSASDVKSGGCRRPTTPSLTRPVAPVASFSQPSNI